MKEIVCKNCKLKLFDIDINGKPQNIVENLKVNDNWVYTTTQGNLGMVELICPDCKTIDLQSFTILN